MSKLTVWTFALCTVLFPFGEAVARPRMEPPIARRAPEAAPAATLKAQGPAAVPGKAANAKKSPERPIKLEEQAKVPATKAAIQSAKKVRRAPNATGPCFSPQVHVVRRRGEVLEHRDLALTFCDGAPNPGAIDSVSVLARARAAERPLMPEIRAYRRRPLDRGPIARRRRSEYLSEQVMRVHPDLLIRLQKVAQRFPGKTIEVVSGHRPDARDTSRHHHGRALDLRVEGVSREALRDFLRSIDETGVGYYPNSYFVHMDVREKRGYWVDRSGPGEAADYGRWPPSERDVEQATGRVVASALRDLASLGESAVSMPPTARAGAERQGEVEAEREAESETHEEPSEDALTRDQIARIRAEALSAIEDL